MAIGWVRTAKRNKLTLSAAVEFTLPIYGTGLAMKRKIKTVFDESAAHIIHRSTATAVGLYRLISGEIFAILMLVDG